MEVGLTDEEFERWLAWANDIEPDMRDGEEAVTASREAEAECELGAHDCAVACAGDREMGNRWMGLLKRVEHWAGTLLLLAMGAAAADSLRKGQLVAGLLGLLFLVALVAAWQRAKRLFQLGDDQALAEYLPQDVRACRVEQQGEALVFRDLRSQQLLLPIQMGDIYYLADPELMPQYRNRREDDGC